MTKHDYLQYTSTWQANRPNRNGKQYTFIDKHGTLWSPDKQDIRGGLLITPWYFRGWIYSSSRSPSQFPDTYIHAHFIVVNSPLLVFNLVNLCSLWRICTWSWVKSIWFGIGFGMWRVQSQIYISIYSIYIYVCILCTYRSISSWEPIDIEFRYCRYIQIYRYMCIYIYIHIDPYNRDICIYLYAPMYK